MNTEYALICPGDWLVTDQETGRKHTMNDAAFKAEFQELPDRRFPYSMPRKWRNKERPEKIIQVLPWFQPLEESSQFDFIGIFRDVFPEMAGDLLENREIYRGLVLQAGWQIRNGNNVWVCAPMMIQDHFEDLGEWPKDEEIPEFMPG